MQEHELIIIGAGIAGVSAAIYAKRAGLNPVLFEKTAIGGQLLFVDKIENYPGLKLDAKGYELVDILSNSVKDLSLKVISEEISDISQNGEKIILTSSKDKYQAKALIAATGAQWRKLGCKGEAEFSGKGVSFCAVCDGFFFKQKEVAVIGGGNTAVEEALYLSEICKKVYLVHRRDSLRAVDYLQKQLFAKDNIEVIWNSSVFSIEGNHLVEKIILSSKDGGKKEIALQGVFIAIGVKPSTQLFSKLIDRDDFGFIITDDEMKTSNKAVYACGDCRKRPLRQLITAASEGATAALSAYRFLRDAYISA